MRTDIPQPIHLADYRPPAFLVDEVELDFSLEPSATRVKSRMRVRRAAAGSDPLVLDGVRLKLERVAIDGQEIGDNRYQLTDESLTLPDLPDSFTLETEVVIDPQANTYLEGLYMSAGRFCTQC